MTAPRLAVVGAGWWAANHHVPSLAAYDGARLVALCDPQRDRALELADTHGVPEVVTDVADLRALDVDGVLVATPHATHRDLAAQALDLGWHVFVEKPLTTTAQDAVDLVTRAEGAGLHLAVGYTDQYTPAATLVREAVQSDIGELVQVMAEFSSGTGSLFARAEEADPDADDAPEDQHPESYGAEAGGGQAHTQLTHVMGMVCWVTDRQVAEVAALVDNRGREVDVDDVAAFRFTGGGTGVVASSGMAGPARGERHVVRYLGTRGVLDQDMMSGRAVLRRSDGVDVTIAAAHEDPERTWQPARTFADVIAGRAVNPAPGRQAAAAAAFIDAALTSARTRTFVSVPQMP